MLHFTRLAFGIIMIGTSALAEEQGNSPSESNLGPTNQLCEALLRSCAQVRSLRAVIHSHRVDREMIVETVVAAKGLKRMESLRHMPVAADHDFNSVVQAYDGKTWILFQPLNRRYEVTRRFADPWLWKIKEHFVYESLGWWPPDDPTPAPRSNGEPLYLKDILRDKRLQERSPTKNEAGVACRVLEIPGVVRLYVDPKLAVVRQRDYFKKTKTGEEKLTARYILDDFRKCGEGVLLPFRMERIFPDDKFHSIHLVQSYEVNTVSDGAFTFEAPPGSFVYDRDTDTSRQVPGGLDGLENIVERSLGVLQDNSGEKGKNDGVTPFVFTGFAIGLSTVIAPCMFVRSLQWFKRRSGRSKEESRKGESVGLKEGEK